MAVDFRCENCGKLLSVDEQPGNAVRCPHCRKKVTVPAGLAALPRPHVPPNASPPPPGVSPDGQQEGELEDENVEGEAVIGAMATIMPWVISVFLHLGVFLIMLFFVMVAVPTGIPTTVVIPDAALNLDNPGGVMNPKTETVSKSAAYWFADAPDGKTDFPVRWQLLYRVGDGEWTPVPNPSEYLVEADQFCEVTFDPITADAMRLEVTLKPDHWAGLHEWSVE